MNGQITQLVKSLFQKESLEQCSVQELQQYAERHPFFGAAQLLLTKKLQVENSVLYNEQLQKTFLFFHNPLWVEQLLDETENANTVFIETNEKDITVADAIETPVPEPVVEFSPAIDLDNSQEIEEPEELRKTAENIETTATEVFEPDNTNEIPSDEPAISLPVFKMEEIDPATADLIFEPYHTVDYFASQGIEFKEEEKPVDKFGMQLKSFTAWLKTMKKLPAAAIDNLNENKNSPEVEVLAEHSITEREIVTETMASVWEKQGNLEKAIDIYNKLSLLEPAKSPYFAAKIEALKKST